MSLQAICKCPECKTISEMPLSDTDGLPVRPDGIVLAFCDRCRRSVYYDLCKTKKRTQSPRLVMA